MGFVPTHTSVSPSYTSALLLPGQLEFTLVFITYSANHGGDGMRNSALKKDIPVGSHPFRRAIDSTVTGPVPRQGLKFEILSEADFTNFVRQHATSPR
jgi:hypothetical protein